MVLASDSLVFKKASLVLRYVASVQEKLRWLRRAVEGAAKMTDVEALSQTCPGGRYNYWN